MKYIVYDIASGDIVKTYSGPESFLAMQYDAEKQACIAGGLPSWKYYVENGKLVEFVEQNTYLDGLTLRSLPDNCTIKINCQSYEATGPDVALDFDQYGEYEITVLADRYYRKDFKIDYQPS